MSFLKQQVGEEWYDFMKDSIIPVFKDDWKKIVRIYKERKCYPSADNIFRAFKEVPLDDVKVVLIGQDPYHDRNKDGTGVATGLCFDTDGKKSTPSLRQMFYGYTNEYPHSFYTDIIDGMLHRWTESGILMLNTALSVEMSNAGSHTHLWENFTEALFKELNKIDRPIMYLAWGKHAQIVTDTLIDNPKHEVVKAKHPASAIYSKTDWDSEGSFKAVEKFLWEKYKEKVIWYNK